MNSSENIRSLSNDRLDDAIVLKENKKFIGAYYLAGYSVELRFKAKLCDRFCIPDLFSDSRGNGESKGSTDQGIGQLKKVFKTHNLNLLLLGCGLKDKYEKWRNRILNEYHNSLVSESNNENDQVIITENTRFMDLIFNWKEDLRYKSCDKDINEEEIGLLLDFLKNDFLKWIDEN